MSVKSKDLRTNIFAITNLWKNILNCSTFSVAMRNVEPHDLSCLKMKSICGDTNCRRMEPRRRDPPKFDWNFVMLDQVMKYNKMSPRYKILNLVWMDKPFVRMRWKKMSIRKEHPMKKRLIRFICNEPMNYGLMRRKFGLCDNCKKHPKPFQVCKVAVILRQQQHYEWDGAMVPVAVLGDGMKWRLKTFLHCRVLLVLSRIPHEPNSRALIVVVVVVFRAIAHLQPCNVQQGNHRRVGALEEEPRLLLLLLCHLHHFHPCRRQQYQQVLELPRVLGIANPI
mmetsp:Transcript_728/g.1342  ORF Transcript_728/g.1342 Transcript_728/m.1342 type:complete len:281 (+) Transcript_728:452-1294(+)